VVYKAFILAEFPIYIRALDQGHSTSAPLCIYTPRRCWPISRYFHLHQVPPGRVANRSFSKVPYGPVPPGCSQFEILVGETAWRSDSSGWAEALYLARGTGEIGPFGIVVGDTLVPEVAAKVPGSRGYAVQYPADSKNSSIPIGVTDAIARLETQSKACPNQRFALVGYSQGAIVMHYVFPYISADIQSSILAFVMFGDPALNLPMTPPLPSIVQSRLWENCAPGDPVRHFLLLDVSEKG
jgi:cutinase